MKTNFINNLTKTDKEFYFPAPGCLTVCLQNGDHFTVKTIDSHDTNVFDMKKDIFYLNLKDHTFHDKLYSLYLKHDTFDLLYQMPIITFAEGKTIGKLSIIMNKITIESVGDFHCDVISPGADGGLTYTFILKEDGELIVALDDKEE